MNEYKISVFIRHSSTRHDCEWKNHIVWAFNRKDACEAIMDYFCGHDIVSIVFDRTNWDKE